MKNKTIYWNKLKIKKQLNKQKEAPLRLAASSSPSLNQQMTKNHSKQEKTKGQLTQVLSQ